MARCIFGDLHFLSLALLTRAADLSRRPVATRRAFRAGLPCARRIVLMNGLGLTSAVAACLVLAI